jgi:Fic family protein
MTVVHQWRPIEDLTVKDLSSASAELPPLAEVWKEQRAELADDRAVEQFNERLQREWAIETGVIERIYSLDRGITRLLIERGIDADLIPHGATDKDPELVAAIIRDQESAVEWLFDAVATPNPLTTSFVKQLHALMTAHQETVLGLDQFGKEVEVPLRKGDYKLRPNNPVRSDGSFHEYAPPEQVASEMEHLVELHAQHLDRDAPAEVEAAWLHHRFTQIHPFQDGNGRVARALASLVFINAGWFPLVVTRDDRTKYIDALEAADRGELEPLVSLFAAIQRRAFVGALGIARDVLQEEHRVEQLIDAISDLFSGRDAAFAEQLRAAKDVAAEVWKEAGARFEQVAAQIDEGIHHPTRRRRAFADFAAPDDDERRTWHRWQVVESAKEHLGYFANPGDFSAWDRICLETENGRSEILLSFHTIGKAYRGIVGASMSFYRRQESEAGERQIVDHQTVCDEVFQINYKESADAVKARFRHWLELGLVKALETWRQGE